MNTTKVDVSAKWTGCYPCLCHGEWTLTVDGKDVSSCIPKCLRYHDMNTLGVYSKWSFDKDYDVVWDSYEDGLGYDA